MLGVSSRFFLGVVVLACVMVTLGGCASIIHGSTTQLPVSSSPAGAEVQVSGGKRGTTTHTTPATVTLDNSYDYVLTFTKPGYQVEQAQVTRVVRGMVAGNLIFGGLIGGAVDAGTGAAWRLVPEAVSVTLRPLDAGEARRDVNPAAISLRERREMMDRLRAEGKITKEEHDASIKAIEREAAQSS